VKWFLAAALINLLVYHPSFHRVFAADQVSYLAELKGDTSLAAGLRLADYGVSRRYWKGDETLFRPLLFVWMAVANSLFGYNYLLWNIANFLIHLAVVFWLYKLLSQLQEGIFAGLFAILFSVMTAGCELVMWNHLGGYMLGFACMLAALWAAERGSLVLCVCAATLSCFFYECMVPVSLLLAAYVFHRRRETGIPLRLAALLPAILFGAVYLVHRHYASRFAFVSRADYRAPFTLSNLAELPLNCGWLFFDWTRKSLLPSLLLISTNYMKRFACTFTLNTNAPTEIANACILVLLLVFLWEGISRKHIAKRLPLLLFCVVTLGAYAAILATGRSMLEIDRNCYYPYFFELIFIIIVYSLVDFTRLSPVARGASIGALVLFIVLNAALTSSRARGVETQYARADHYFSFIARFIGEHRNEPGFSFVVKNPPPEEDPPYKLREGYPDQKTAPMTEPPVSAILYARYYDAIHPRYIYNGQIP